MQHIIKTATKAKLITGFSIGKHVMSPRDLLSEVRQAAKFADEKQLLSCIQLF